MINIQLIRDNPELIKEKAAQKGYEVDIQKLLDLDKQRIELLRSVEVLRQERNQIAEKMKLTGSQPDHTLIERGRQIKLELSERENYLEQAETQWLELLRTVPNMPLNDVPVGASEDENVVSKKVGDLPKFDFEPLNHAQIAQTKGWLDKERAAKVTGARFAYVKGDMVKLQFALIQFVINKLSDQAFIDELISENNLNVSNKPFLPILPPLMIREEVFNAMDRLEPRDDRYKIDGEDLWLQGSAEHVLGSMHLDEVIDEKDLPIRYIGYATSFRREAGTYGKDMEGLFRMHQFDKLEMESLAVPEKGLDEHLLLIAIQEKLMQLLKIPYQVLNKCTADIGKPNARGVDVEAWLPGQNKYRETHTADYMTDYQARRLKTRVRRSSEANLELIHTNDATAMPLSRGPIAIIENFQTSEGDVVIPEVLRPYLGGLEKI